MPRDLSVSSVNHAARAPRGSVKSATNNPSETKLETRSSKAKSECITMIDRAERAPPSSPLLSVDASVTHAEFRFRIRATHASASRNTRETTATACGNRSRHFGSGAVGSALLSRMAASVSRKRHFLQKADEGTTCGACGATRWPQQKYPRSARKSRRERWH